MAPNKEYNGTTATVPFRNGVGETDDPYLKSWFKKHGYHVEEEKEQATVSEEAASEKPQQEEKTTKKAGNKKAGE